MLSVKLRRTHRLGLIALAGLLLASLPALAADDDKLSGSVELIYRSVSQDGSSQKYDEDFDGLSSGGRISNLSLNWLGDESDVVDYARLNVQGLGGDPYESQWFRMGQKDSYEFSFKRTKQDYIYNLFELVGDEDGASWDAEREMNDLSLRLFPKENLQLIFQFQEGQRTGNSIFLKDIQRDVFRLETPLDQVSKRYTVGADFQVGTLDFVFRQTLRRYDNHFENSTEGDQGLDLAGTTTLDFYDWNQRDTGGADYTTLKVHAPLGDRVDLSISLYGTLFGEEDLTSRVNVSQAGTDYAAAEFGGVCLASPGVACSTDATCDALVGGDVCVFNEGVSRAELEGDTLMFDVGLGVGLHETLDLLLEYRSLDRDLNGTIQRDLDGDGGFEDPDGDAIVGSETLFDYEINTTTATLAYQPTRELRLRAGYRMIDRELIRAGFGGLRDTDLDSDEDDTLIFGASWRPAKWFKFNADYEDGEIKQPFNAVAPFESEHTRVRASFMPQSQMRVDLTYLDFENTNTAEDFRAPGQFWDSSQEGTTWSGNFWHKPNDDLDYGVRYARQEIDSNVRVVFDRDFGPPPPIQDGNSIFDTDNTQFGCHARYAWSNFTANLRWASVESDGDNLALGDVDGLLNNAVIDQDYQDIELGLTYSFDSGMYLGASFRDFDYDDGNDLLDYEGDIFTVRAGLTF